MRLGEGGSELIRCRVVPERHQSTVPRASQILAALPASTCAPCPSTRHGQTRQRYLRHGRDGRDLGSRRLGVERRSHRGHRPDLGVRPGPAPDPGLVPALGAEHPGVACRRHPDRGVERRGEVNLGVEPVGAECFRGSGACPCPGSTRTGCYRDAAGEESPYPGSSKTDYCRDVVPAPWHQLASQRRALQPRASGRLASERMPVRQPQQASVRQALPRELLSQRASRQPCWLPRGSLASRLRAWQRLALRHRASPTRASQRQALRHRASRGLALPVALPRLERLNRS